MNIPVQHIHATLQHKNLLLPQQDHPFEEKHGISYMHCPITHLTTALDIPVVDNWLEVKIIQLCIFHWEYSWEYDFL